MAAVAYMHACMHACGGHHAPTYTPCISTKPTVETEAWVIKERSDEELLEAVTALWSDMQQQGVPPDETIYTNLARAAAVTGDAAAALAWADKVAEAEAAGGGRGAGGGKMVARLRTYQPALLGFALAGRAGDALALAARLAATGKDYLDLTGDLCLHMCDCVSGGAALRGRVSRLQLV